MIAFACGAMIAFACGAQKWDTLRGGTLRVFLAKNGGYTYLGGSLIPYFSVAASPDVQLYVRFMSYRLSRRETRGAATRLGARGRRAVGHGASQSRRTGIS